MDKENKKRKIISLSIMLFIVMLLVSAGSFAYWTWVTASSERTNVSLTIEAPNMSARLTGHTQNITNLIPISSCTDETYAIKKELTLTYDNLSTNAGMITGTLSVTNFVSPYGTPDSDDLSHLHYAVTTSPDSCTTKPVRGMSGTFKATSGNLFTDVTLKGSVPVNTEGNSQKYYLWVWLDSEYTHQNVGSGVTNDPMQNISFTLTWSGALANDRTEPEQPVLDPGMIPVKIANNGTVTTVLEHDTSWYNYDNKQWANVVLVDSDSRSTYKGTTGKTVNQSDILAYYTWIPKYSYKIPEMTCGQISNPTLEAHPECYAPYMMSDSDKQMLIQIVQAYAINNLGISDFSLEMSETLTNEALQTGKYVMEMNGVVQSMTLLEVIDMANDMAGTNIVVTPSSFNANNKINAPRTIDISFESKNASVLTGDVINTYRTHPAFTFGTENISGIWVGKFETSTESTSTCYTTPTKENCNNINQAPRVLPNVSSLRYQNISTQFTTSLKFAGGTLSNGIVSFTGNNTYGLTSNIDSHMMKNSEWGAVAYLSHSSYGINDEIRINNYWDNGPKTGCGASEENGEETNTCQIAYGGASSYPQSTTGNISGVFDMSGGAWEYTMGVLADDSGNPRSGDSTDWNSGFNGLLPDGTSYTSGIAFPSSKYYDLYTSQNSLTACNGGVCYGHALSETAGWYLDYADFVRPDSPWFGRGGGDSDGVDAGVFYSDGGDGNAGVFSWRSVLVVE